jgi:hypothetical protein
MNLEFRNDDNLAYSDKEPGSYFNNTDRIVLLRLPDVDELKRLWEDFDRELRSQLKDLLVRPYGEIVREFGNLGFSTGKAAGREGELFGMLTQNSEKLAHFSKPALFAAAAALDLVADQKPNGQPRKRMKRGDGKIVDQVLAMPRDAQKAIIEVIVDDHENIDEWMLVTQGSEVGWEYLRSGVQGTTDTRTFLEKLAADTDRAMGERENLVVRHADPNEKIRYAPRWFSQFLAKRKIWVWPARYVSRVIHLYPARFTPLVARMSVSAQHGGLADVVFRYHQGKGNTSSAVALQAFAAAALCGNTFETGRGSFNWFPMAAFKEKIPSLSASNFLSSSLNAVYKIAVEHGGGSVKDRSEAHLFVNGARLAQIGVDAFNWTSSPTEYNTQLASKMLERPVTAVPAHVKSWAAQLRELLPEFGNEAVKQVEDALDLWLIFLMTIEPGEAPKDFQSISRRDHVHDLSGDNTSTFWDFLNAYYKDKPANLPNRAITKMRQGFELAARRGRFDAGNPFDTKLDKVRGGYTKRADVTPRKPMELEAWELVVRKNREGDYAFARGLGPSRCHHTLRNPETGEYENVFWPAEAIVVDIILNSGMRHKSGRWVDSGEGDEKIIDRATMKMVDNPHPAATLGRKDCFLQISDLPGKKSRRVFGQKVISNKTGKPYTIPWVDAGIVDAFYRMLALQAKYNPIHRPAKPIKKRTRELTRVDPERLPDIFPLFRDPNDSHNMAVSDYKVLAYWKDLLRYCQEDVNKLFGHEYPLITEDGLVFDLHALRVTMVSNLLEAGVSLEVVKDLVGHATAMMTWYYNGLRSAKLNVTVQAAMEARSAAHDRLAAKDKDAIEEYADEAVVPDFVDHHVGVGMLRKYGERQDLAPFEIFLHGICPGGSCSTGGEMGSGERFLPVWRERACSGCRYRVTGPKFLPGIQNRINNLCAELRLAEQRARELSREIEEKELETGKEDRALRSIQRSESGFKNKLSEELAKELRVQKAVQKVRETALDEGGAADNLLLPVTSGFDETALGYGLEQVHEFELFWTLVKETRLLPASIVETAHGVESHMKKLLKTVLRANNLAELTAPLSDRQETDTYLQIGGALLERYPDPDDFQQLVDGAVKLDHDALEDIRKEVRAVIASMPKTTAQIEFAA